MNERQPSRSAGICIALMLALLAVAAINSPPAQCAAPAATPTVSVLATGLQGAFGSTVGPDGALYVAESAAGRISRINPRTGQITTFASGLPKTVPAVGVGGATDVAFIGKTMYVLVTLVSPDVGGSSVDGIYRLDDPNHFTVVANIGDFNERNPPTIPFPFFVKSGVLFAMKPYRKGFLVTDGHLNRMLQVTQDGQISILIAFDDIVPTGLTLHSGTIYMAGRRSNPRWNRANCTRYPLPPADRPARRPFSAHVARSDSTDFDPRLVRSTVCCGCWADGRRMEGGGQASVGANPAATRATHTTLRESRRRISSGLARRGAGASRRPRRLEDALASNLSRSRTDAGTREAAALTDGLDTCKMKPPSQPSRTSTKDGNCPPSGGWAPPTRSPFF
jgi:hypothetical protein